MNTDYRRAPDILTMLDVIRKGTEITTGVDLGHFPNPQPLPDLLTKQYLDAPCNNPKERYGALQYNRTCQCGYLMGQHK